VGWKVGLTNIGKEKEKVKLCDFVTVSCYGIRVTCFGELVSPHTSNDGKKNKHHFRLDN
jgi:hypothetical protein